jgi:probable F420-dependent oxidoreductase
MKIGIPIPNVDKPGGARPILEVAKLADSSGFDSVWLGDHIVRPIGEIKTSYWKNKPNRYQGELFEPMVTAGYVAGVTQNVRIGFGVLVLPYRNPVVIAKSIASLDQLSGGRMILGVGSGYWREEFEALGIPYGDRVARYKESVQLLRDMWASDTPSHQGKYWQVDEVLFKPRPIQDPVPIWIGGVTEASLEYAIAVADGWHPARFRVDTLRPLVDKLHVLADLAGRDMSNFTICNRPAVRFADKVQEDDSQQLVPGHPVATPAPFVGPPDYIVEQLAAFKAELGINDLIIDLHEGDALPDLLKAIELFAAEVRPQLDGV